MFTGLVQERGKVSAIEVNETSAKIIIASSEISSDVKQGDSVSVNGVCLTVVEKSPETFAVDVMAQTLQMTSTGSLDVGSLVNLELATRTSDRLGGHIVQGHVDGVAHVQYLTQDEKWTRMDVIVPTHLMKYIVAQGSVCLEGVSLTVGQIDDSQNQITVWLIPETLANTNLSIKNTGDPLNLEVDVLAKYVERLMNRSEVKND
jgi:riboflavin synthase